MTCKSAPFCPPDGCHRVDCCVDRPAQAERSERATDDPLVCHLCGQRLVEGERCNSGYHQGPDNPNGFDGRPVPLSESDFVKPWNPSRAPWPRRRRRTAPLSPKEKPNA